MQGLVARHGSPRQPPQRLWSKPKRADRGPLWRAAVQQHLLEVGNGSVFAVTPSTEAYATMWYGDTSSHSFAGVKALLQSIRSFDATRHILLMTPVPKDEVGNAETDESLLLLQRAIPRVVQVRVPLQTIFKNASRVCTSSTMCGGTAARSYMFTYSKFALWGLTRWSRIMYLDIDLLVTRSLEEVWQVRIGTERALVAASYVIRSKTDRGIFEASCGYLRPGNMGYNTGLMLLQPSRALTTYLAHAMDQWKRKFKSPCRSDQTYFNTMFQWYTRCVSYSANCRDPRFVNTTSPPDPNASVSVLSRCLEPIADVGVDASTRTPLATPFTVHFACGSKPWLPENRHSYFARVWQQHLDAVNQKMGLGSSITSSGSGGVSGGGGGGNTRIVAQQQQQPRGDGSGAPSSPAPCAGASLVPGQLAPPRDVDPSGKASPPPLWRQVLEALLLPGRVAQPWNNYYDDLTTLLRRKQEGTHDWAGTPPLNSMRVAEIGTMYGGASERILQQLPKVTEHFAIDPFLAGYDDNDMTSVKLGRFAREKNATREQFSRAWADAMAHDFWAHFGCRYHLLHAKSLDAAPRFADGSLDVAFIDGLHTREGAADDIAAWWPKLKPNGGLMVLNDYGTRIFPGVKTAAHAFFGPRGLAVKVGRRGKPPGHRNAYVVRRE